MCVSLCRQLGDLQDSAPEKSKEQVLGSAPPSGAQPFCWLGRSWHELGFLWDVAPCPLVGKGRALQEPSECPGL